MTNPPDNSTPDVWATILEDVWARFVRYRQQDRGQSLAEDIDRYRGSFISSSRPPDEPRRKDLRSDRQSRERLLAFAADYIPPREDFEIAIRREIEAGHIQPPASSTQSTPPTEEELLNLLRSEDELWNAIEWLMRDAVETYLLNAGVPKELAVQAPYYVYLLLPHTNFNSSPNPDPPPKLRA
jgi:hypothetical protein